MTLQGEHNEGNPFNNDAFMYGGIGKVKLAAGSQTKWIGKNTRFTKQFRGTSGKKTPFKLVVTTASGDKDHTVTKVISDTELHTATSDFAADSMADYVPFSLGTPRGTGALKFGPATAEVVMRTRRRGGTGRRRGWRARCPRASRARWCSPRRPAAPRRPSRRGALLCARGTARIARRRSRRTSW